MWPFTKIDFDLAWVLGPFNSDIDWRCKHWGIREVCYLFFWELEHLKITISKTFTREIIILKQTPAKLDHDKHTHTTRQLSTNLVTSECPSGEFQKQKQAPVTARSEQRWATLRWISGAKVSRARSLAQQVRHSVFGCFRHLLGFWELSLVFRSSTKTIGSPWFWMIQLFSQAIPWMHFMDLCDFFFGHGIKWQHRTDTGVIGWGMPWRSLLPRLKICRFQVHINKTFRCARHWFDTNCQVLFDQEKLDEFKTNRWQVQVGTQ